MASARYAIHLIFLLVNGAVMPATEQREIRERSGTAVCSVANVMSLAEPHPAAGEATAAVAVVEGAT